MKKVIILISFLLPILLFGQRQRLGISPTSFKLSKTHPKGIANAFCSDGIARVIEGETKGVFKYFQSPEGIEVMVDGKVFPGGIDKLISTRDILINTKNDDEVIFILNPKSKYQNVSVNIREHNLLADTKDDFKIADLWVHKLTALKILPDNITTFKEANQYLKEFQKLNELEIQSGLLTKETQALLDKYSYSVGNLTECGYLEKGFNKFDEILNAEKKLNADFGDSYLYSPTETLRELDDLNKTDGDAYKSFLITKSVSNEYVIFNGLKKAIFRGTDEIEIANSLSNLLSQNENAYFVFNNFESLEKQESLLSTIRIQPNIIKRGISLNKLPSSYDADLMFAKLSELKLSTPLLEENIVPTKYNSKDYFSAKLKIEAKSYAASKTEVEALSTKKSVLETLIKKTNTLFSNISEKISLMKFFNSFKKDLKSTMQIESDDEFFIHIKNEFEDIRIVKVSGSDHIYYTMN